jgi:hypothetical protein
MTGNSFNDFLTVAFGDIKSNFHEGTPAPCMGMPTLGKRLLHSSIVRPYSKRLSQPDSIRYSKPHFDCIRLHFHFHVCIH